MYRIQIWRLKILLSRTDLPPPILNSVRLSRYKGSKLQCQRVDVDD